MGLLSPSTLPLLGPSVVGTGLSKYQSIHLFYFLKALSHLQHSHVARLIDIVIIIRNTELAWWFSG